MMALDYIGELQAGLQSARLDTGRYRREVSILSGKLYQRVETIKHLHDRLARVQNSKKNKSSQLARLISEGDALRARIAQLEGGHG